MRSFSENQLCCSGMCVAFCRPRLYLSEIWWIIATVSLCFSFSCAALFEKLSLCFGVIPAWCVWGAEGAQPYTSGPSPPTRSWEMWSCYYKLIIFISFWLTYCTWNRIRVNKLTLTFLFTSSLESAISFSLLKLRNLHFSLFPLCVLGAILYRLEEIGLHFDGALFQTE